jgi:hypothetical protein
MKLSPQSRNEKPMHRLLEELPDVVNGIFNVLDLIVVRATLLGLAIIGAYTILRGRRSRA